MTTLHVIYDDTRRADIIKDIVKANAEATAIRRTGYTGTRGWRYGIVHDSINSLLSQLEGAPDDVD